MSYNTTTTTDITTSSAYLGFGGQEVVIFKLSGNILDQLYQDGNVSPGLIDGSIQPTSDMLTSYPPRHGEKVGSPSYLPPVSILIPWMGMVDQQIANYAAALFNSIGYITNPAPFYIRNRMWYIQSALDTIHSGVAQPFDGIFYGPTGYLSSFLNTINNNSLTLSTTSPSSPVLGNNYIDTTSNASLINNNSLVVGGASSTLLYVYNKSQNANVTIGSVSAGAGLTTVVIVEGNLTIYQDAWFTGTGTILVICTGAIILGNTNAASIFSQPNVAAFALGSITVTGSPTINNSLIYGANTVVTVTNLPSFYSNLFPPNSVAKIHGRDSFGLTSSVSGDGSGGNWYNLVSNDGTENFSQVLDALVLQFAYQYQIPVNQLSWTLNSNGVYEIVTLSPFPFIVQTCVGFQLSPTSLPNVGIHTEPFNFENYVVKMAQSYRVQDDVYAYYKPGFYLTIGNNGDIAISQTPLTIPTTSYNIKNATIASQRRNSISDDIPRSVDGGMDPFYLVGGLFTSKYTTLSRPPLTTSPNYVDLNSSAGFAVLANSGIADTPSSSVFGNVGSRGAASSITISQSEVAGGIYGGDNTGPVGTIINPNFVENALGDAIFASDSLAAKSPASLLNTEIGGQTLQAGIYKSTNATISSNLILNGSASDVWIFQIAGTLSIANSITVTLTGGAVSSNIFWNVAGVVTLGTTSSMQGTIISQNNIVLQTGSIVNGRVISVQGSVTMNAATIYPPQSLPLPSILPQKTFFLKENYNSFVNIQPFNGRITDSDANLGMITVFNTDRKAKVIYRDCVVRASSLTGALVCGGINTADTYSSTNLTTTFINANFITFSINNKSYSIGNGGNLIVGADTYSYTVSGTTAKLFKNTVLNTTFTLTAEPLPSSDITIRYVIIFGDMLNATFTRVLSTLSFQYFDKFLDDMYLNYLPSIITPEQKVVDITYDDPAQIQALQQAGFVISGSQAIRATNVTFPIYSDDITIQGLVTLYYPQNATQVLIPLVDGNYNGVVVMNGLVNISSLPITVADREFVAVMNPTLLPAPLTATYTAASFLQFLSTLSNPIIIASSGVTVTSSFTSGACLITGITGTGTITITDNTGGVFSTRVITII